MRKKTNKNEAKTIVLKLGAIVFAAIFCISAFCLIIELYEGNNLPEAETSPSLNKSLSVNGKDYVLKDNIETLLLLGLDKFENADSGYNNDKQADFLLLLVIDKDTNSCKAIHVNRDTMADMNILGVAGDKIGTVKKQIALSHTYGNGREVSCRNSANAVSDLFLGVEIDHYVSVTMEAVSVLNDLVGGVKVELLDDFSHIDSSMIKGEQVLLNGEQALMYVRSRYGLDDPSNIARMERQKQYLESLYKQSKELADADEGFIQRAALKVTDYIVSDCSVNKLQSLAESISGYEFEGILSLSGESVKGDEFMEFYPDEASVMEIVIDCFYKNKD